MSRPSSKKPRSQNMDNMFLGGMNDVEQNLYGNVEDSADLEAELLALVGGGSPNTARPKPSPQKQFVDPNNLPKELMNLDNDDDAGDDDIDEDDPNLLAELAEVMGGSVVDRAPSPSPKKGTTPQKQPKLEVANNFGSLIDERIENYQAAISSAKESNDDAKARRFDRGLNTLRTLKTKAEKGASISPDDIPPAVPVKSAPKPSGQQIVVNYVNPPSPIKDTAPHAGRMDTRPQVSNPPPTPSPSKDQPAADNSFLVKALLDRQMEYRKAALAAKTNGNIDEAKEFLTVAKQFDDAIGLAKGGEVFSLDDIPESPVVSPPANAPPQAAPPTQPKEVAPPPPPAKQNQSLPDALNERLAIFKNMESSATQGNDTSKARRYGRVVKQYEEAIQTTLKRKPFNYDELPAPPGLGALPVTSVPKPAAQPAGQMSSGPPPLQRSLSRSSNQQLVFLLERQKQFKAAALNAKSKGNVDLAMQLLRQSKSFDQVIRAAESGLPVDMSKMPKLPGEKNIDFEFLEAEECEAPDDLISDDPKVVYSKLQQILNNQMKTAHVNAAKFKKVGDVVTADKFEKLSKTCIMDLSALNNSMKHGDPVPRYHFEWKTFSVVQSNPDLGDNQLELSIIQGRDFALPSGFKTDNLDTYLKIELPFPSDEPQHQTTDTVKSTNSPVYNFTCKFQINRKSRAFLRVCQSRGIKIDIYYRRGLLKKDALLGTVTLKMPELEKKCTVHSSYDIYEGRKVIGGKLEAQLRIREAIAGKQSEDMRERWLVIDRLNQPTAAATATATAKSLAPCNESISVMKYEKESLQNKIGELKNQLTPAMEQTLMDKLKEWNTKIAQQEKLLKCDPNERKRYIQMISELAPKYNEESRLCLSQGNRDKAQIFMTKKKLIETEVNQLRNMK